MGNKLTHHLKPKASPKLDQQSSQVKANNDCEVCEAGARDSEAVPPAQLPWSLPSWILEPAKATMLYM